MALEKYEPIKKLIREGRIDEARALLAQAAKEDPQDPHAWYGLAQVVDDPAKKKYCLERAARLAPDEPAIATQLARLNAAGQLAAGLVLPPSIPTRKAPKKETSSSRLGWLLVAVTVILVPCFVIGLFGYYVNSTFNQINQAILGAPANPMDGSSGSSGSSTGASHSVVYRVEGSAGSAMISYNKKEGQTEVIQSTKLPWSTRLTRKDAEFVTVVAQPNEAGKSVTCSIVVDGKVWKRATNQGGLGLAICAGLIGAD